VECGYQRREGVTRAQEARRKQTLTDSWQRSKSEDAALSHLSINDYRNRSRAFKVLHVDTVAVLFGKKKKRVGAWPPGIEERSSRVVFRRASLQANIVATRSQIYFGS